MSESTLVWLHRFYEQELGIKKDGSIRKAGIYILVPVGDARKIFIPSENFADLITQDKEVELFLTEVGKTVTVKYADAHKNDPTRNEHRVYLGNMIDDVGEEVFKNLIYPGRVGCFYRKEGIVCLTIVEKGSSYDLLLKEFPQRGRDSNLVTEAVFVSENVSEYQVNSSKTNHSFPPPHQVIYFGSPGTGKSHTVEEKTQGLSTTRITFHPDSDYQSFVGSYRPEMVGDDIQYKFVPQAFIKAYCHAWLNVDQPHHLIIEEINRGNCAQIFGDIFQCLDRKEDGYSKYVTEVSTEISNYIKGEFSKFTPEQTEKYLRITKSSDNKFNNISLPPNFYLLATMNTSDQSLFPMDSAFKRRWSWNHIPIDYNDADKFVIKISDDCEYNWGSFIRKINPRIRELTESEDKLLGNRFINPHNYIVEYEEFVSKVLFYLWDEIYKDEYQTSETIFQHNLNGTLENFSFNDFFKDNSVDLLKSFLNLNEVEPTQSEILDDSSI